MEVNKVPEYNSELLTFVEQNEKFHENSTIGAMASELILMNIKKLKVRLTNLDPFIRCLSQGFKQTRINAAIAL